MRIFSLLAFMAIYGGLSFLLGWGIKSWLVALGVFRWEPLFWILFFAAAASMVIGRLTRRLRPVAVIGNCYLFLLEYGLLLSLPGALIVRFTPLGAEAVGTGIALILAVSAAVGWHHAHSPVKRRITLHVAKPGPARPLRIAMASDFHLGIMSSKRHLQAFVDGVNAAGPDLVLLAGDIVDDDAEWFIRRNMGEILGQLKARLGVYGILGNHEYYGGQIPVVTEELTRAGIRLLRDETVPVDGWIRLTGREDAVNRNRKTLEELKREAGLDTDAGGETDEECTAGGNGAFAADKGGGNADTRKAKAGLWIVMDHTPKDLAAPAEAGVDLYLSGHTHRGQLWPNHWITRRMFELDHGCKQKGDMHAIVTSGYGFWGPPLRTGSRSEWWDIELVFLREEAGTR